MRESPNGKTLHTQSPTDYLVTWSSNTQGREWRREKCVHLKKRSPKFINIPHNARRTLTLFLGSNESFLTQMAITRPPMWGTHTSDINSTGANDSLSKKWIFPNWSLLTSHPHPSPKKGKEKSSYRWMLYIQANMEYEIFQNVFRRLKVSS